MSKTTILIVEDEGIVAKDLARKLDQLGLEVTGIAESGEEAVQLAGQLHPDLVLMDIWLKGPMDGIEAAAAIRKEHDIPIVYLTAHSDSATMARAKLTGPFGYILKPFEPRDLATQIEMALYRHQTDRQLREQREWFRVTLGSIGDAVIATDVDGQITFMNAVAEEATGWKLSEAINLPVQKVFHIIAEVSRKAVEDPVSKVLSSGRIVGLANHTLLVRKDGTEIAIDDSGAPISDKKGKIIGVVLVFRDITEKRRAEEALQRLNAELEQRVAERTEELAQSAQSLKAERQRFFDVLETLPTMICLLTTDHHVAFANRSFRERFGESHGRHCYDCCFGRTAPCEFCESYRVLETGQPHHWEINTPDGTVIDCHDFPFTDVDGSPLILEMDVDITARRRTEKELRQAHDNLEERAAQLRALAGELTLTEQRERSRLAKVLHDHLQQLLVGAKFRLAIIEKGAEDVIKKALKEVESLIDESITVSRDLTAELNPPILQEAGLNAGLQWLVRRMADKHGLFIELEMEEDGSIPEQLRIFLFDSIRELLFNVVKHAQTSSAALNLRHVDGHLQITVSDPGIGFNQGKMPAAGGGVGYGLFSIRERLEMLGGTLQVQSTPGQGSRIILSVPITRMAKIDPPMQAVPEQPEAQLVHSEDSKPGWKIRVLLADDHAVVRQGIANLLSDEPNFEVVGQAADGQEAVEMALKFLPDVILMDISMPKLNGIEATRMILKEHPEISIMGLSMFDEPDTAQFMRDAGAIDYLKKTGPAEHLIKAIRAAIYASGSRAVRSSDFTGER